MSDNFEKLAPYYLNYQTFAKRTCTLNEKKADGSKAKTEIIMHDLIQLLKKAENVSFALIYPSFTLDGKEYETDFVNFFDLDILTSIFPVIKKTGSPSCGWYYYDNSWDKEDPYQAHYFFLVSEQEIVSTQAMIADRFDGSFNKEFLEKRSLYLNTNDKINEKAESILFYEKFYNETFEGKIIKIRQDLAEKEFDTTNDTKNNLETKLSEVEKKLSEGTLVLNEISARVEKIIGLLKLGLLFLLASFVFSLIFK